jgi:hypothetical protein
MKIEILHLRDPDSECYHRVFIDGVEIDDTDVDLVDIDPGRGWMRDEWDYRIVEAEAEALNPRRRTQQFADAVLDELQATRDNPFIEEPK